MTFDISRSSFDPTKDYLGVVMQQGRVQLDSDWNEWLAELNRRLQAGTLDVVGAAGVPQSTPLGFKIDQAEGGTLTIGPGRIYVDGLLAENHGAPAPKGTWEWDPTLAEERGITAVPFFDQPYLRYNDRTIDPPVPETADRSNHPSKFNRPDFLATGRSLIYLDVWQREVTPVQDPELIEKAVGIDTTGRLQTVWQVKLLADIGSAGCSTPADQFPEWKKEIRPSGGRLTTSTGTVQTPPDPCQPPAGGGYKGLENQLYRVEIHKGGDLTQATFKWSRDNATVCTRVLEIQANTRLVVESTGRDDDVLGFRAGDWIELLDDWHELHGLPGLLRRIRPGADGVDKATRTLVLEEAVPDGLFPVDNHGRTLAGRNTRLRRWDQAGKVLSADGTVFHNLDDSGTSEGIPVAAGNRLPAASPSVPVSIALEHGIQVQLTLEGEGRFKTGDHWLFAARSIDGTIEALTDAPPRGIHHHFARLAVVERKGGQWVGEPVDCRTLFPPLTEREGGCCTVVVEPGLDRIQAAIDSLPEVGGCVCLKAGVHIVQRPIEIQGLRHVTLHGIGGASRVVYRSAGGASDGSALIRINGVCREIELAAFLAVAEGVEAVVSIDGPEGQCPVTIRLDRLTLINSQITDTPNPSHEPACALQLGRCTDVSLTSSSLVAAVAIRQVIGKGQAPSEPLEEFVCHDNHLHGLRTAIELVDVRNGSIRRNHLSGLPEDWTDLRYRSERQTAIHTHSLSGRDQNEDIEWILHPTGPALALRSVAICADLLDRFVVGDNQVDAEEAIHVGFARDLCINGNRVQIPAADLSRDTRLGISEVAFPSDSKMSPASVKKKQVSETDLSESRVGSESNLNHKSPPTAIAIAYGFAITIRGNKLQHQTSGKTNPENISRIEEVVTRGAKGGIGIALGSVRGLEIADNDIHTDTGIANVDTVLKPTKADDAAKRPASLLRVLGLTLVWPSVIELAWVLNALAQTKNLPTTPTQEFSHSLLQAAVGLLTTPELIPHYIGKAVIADNRMQVTRIGIDFPKVFTVGGLEIRGNRISGFREAGILVHPWLGMSFPSLSAQWIQCSLEWLLAILKLLRDSLKAQQKGQSPPQIPQGTWKGAATATTLVAGVVSFCARYCTAEKTAEKQPDGGTLSSIGAKSACDALIDALDDLLANGDSTWLDDLLNQSYRIDANTLRGSGDGIWTGIDGGVITGNQITIHPVDSTVLEVMALGYLLHKESAEGIPALLAFCLLEADRDIILAAAALIPTLKEEVLNSIMQPLPKALTGIGSMMADTSPLRETSNNLLETQEKQPNNIASIADALKLLLLAIARNLKGYGIVLVGADMTCSGNQVHSERRCGVPSQSRRIAANSTMGATSNATLGAFPLVVPTPSLGGIWHFSNHLSWVFELEQLMYEQFEVKTLNVSDTPPLGRAMKGVSFWLAYVTLRRRRDRMLQIQSNIIDTALGHGIRSLDVNGLEDLAIYDNYVKDASRFAICHRSLLGHDLKCDLKIDRNTVKRTAKVFDLSTVFKSLYAK